MTTENILNTLFKIECNTKNNGYMWASDVKNLINKICNYKEYLETQIKAKNEEINILKYENVIQHQKEEKCCDSCEFLLATVIVCLKRVQLHDGSLPHSFSCCWYKKKGTTNDT